MFLLFAVDVVNPHPEPIIPVRDPAPGYKGVQPHRQETQQMDDRNGQTLSVAYGRHSINDRSR